MERNSLEVKKKKKTLRNNRARPEGEREQKVCRVAAPLYGYAGTLDVGSKRVKKGGSSVTSFPAKA